jgi:hypothetical protein
MNSLVKVPPYSKLNIQGQFFFTQNWCNITLTNCSLMYAGIIKDEIKIQFLDGDSIDWLYVK